MTTNDTPRTEPLTEAAIGHLETGLVLRAKHEPGCGEGAEFPWDCTCDYAGFMDGMGAVFRAARAAVQPAGDLAAAVERLRRFADASAGDRVDMANFEGDDVAQDIRTVLAAADSSAPREDSGLRELRDLVQSWAEGAGQRAARWKVEREWGKADNAESEQYAYEEVVERLDAALAATPTVAQHPEAGEG